MAFRNAHINPHRQKKYTGFHSRAHSRPKETTLKAGSDTGSSCLVLLTVLDDTFVSPWGKKMPKKPITDRGLAQFLVANGK